MALSVVACWLSFTSRRHDNTTLERKRLMCSGLGAAQWAMLAIDAGVGLSIAAAIVCYKGLVLGPARYVSGLIAVGLLLAMILVAKIYLL
jgi:hypothetical protein